LTTSKAKHWRRGRLAVYARRVSLIRREAENKSEEKEHKECILAAIQDGKDKGFTKCQRGNRFKTIIELNKILII